MKKLSILLTAIAFLAVYSCGGSPEKKEEAKKDEQKKETKKLSKDTKEGMIAILVLLLILLLELQPKQTLVLIGVR